MTCTPRRLSCCLSSCMGLLIASGCGRPALEPTAQVQEVSRSFDEIAPPALADDDWAGWRGPGRQGHVVGSAPIEWSENENVLWKVKVPGRGHGSPTVVGDSIYLATADEGTQKQSVVAFDRQTGDQRWQTTLNTGGFPSASQMHPTGTHANSTVASDGERLFIAFLHHDAITAYALDTEGNLLWEEELGPFASRFGYAPSPQVHRSLVLISADHGGGGFLAGLHRESGEVVWRKARPLMTSCSSGVVADVGGRELFVIGGCESLSAYDPATGEEIWSVPGLAETTCGTCVWDDERVYASGGYPDNQTLAVTAAGTAVWDNRTKCYESSMLVTDGHLYAVDDSGIAHCWEADTGTETWKKRLGGAYSASLILAGDNLYATSESGQTTVFGADPQAFQLLATNQLGDEAFATPTVAGGRMYHRVATRDGGRQEWLYSIGAE